MVSRCPCGGALVRATNQLLPILLACVTLVVLITTVEQNMPGFIVGDIQLSYPKLKETFTTLAAILLMFIYPVLVVLHTLVKARYWGLGYCNKRVVQYWWDKTWCGMFICFIFILFSEFMKRFAGKLRPNFFAMCDPEFDEAAGKLYENLGTYITNYTCRNERLGRESARSFPSGHSMFAILLFSAMGNLLESHRGQDKIMDPTWAVKLMIQAWITIIIGPAIALTRYTEHYHHANDVLVGIVLGYIAFFCLLVLEKHWIREPNSGKKGYTGPVNTEAGKVETAIQ